MARERIRRSRLLVLALVAIAVALSHPAAGNAADDGQLASAGVLARGSGYDSPTGSDPVRTLQRRLRRLGNRPGPIDGLYGPLTEGAVERFQRQHGLAVDGIVGRQTKRSLHAPAAQPTAAPAHPQAQPGKLVRKSPVPDVGAESAYERPHARPAPTGVASRDGPQAETGVPPEVVALVAGLAGLLLLAGLWRKREASVSFGLTFAALLGVFGIGAAVGAIFATHAAPDGVDEAKAQTGALLADPGAAHHARAARKTVAGANARRIAADAPAAAPAAAQAASDPPPARPRAASPPARAAAPVQRAKPVTYVVKRGDSLSRIAASELGAGSSGASVAAAVDKLTELNLDQRIRSGDPDLLEAGEELRLR